MGHKGLAIWATALLGFILLMLGVIIGVVGFGIHPIIFWTGVIIAILGLVMIFIAAVLS